MSRAGYSMILAVGRRGSSGAGVANPRAVPHEFSQISG